jgi:DNA-binding PadR family transcriptional regulator
MPRTRAFSHRALDVLQYLLDAAPAWAHGYDIVKTTKVSSGTLYPLLIRLHERGLLEDQWEEPERPGQPARHAYRLTAAGVALARHETQPAGIPGRERTA